MGKIETKEQDLTYLSWSIYRTSSGTAGSFLKAYYEDEYGKIYYKLSSYNSANEAFGNESINEIIVDRLLSILGIEHLEYNLINAKIKLSNKIIKTYLCESRDYKKAGDNKISFDTFYYLEKKDNESILDFCERYGFLDQIYGTLLIDYLILNRDRHGANIEVLKNKNCFRLAPIFDNGVSLLFSCHSDDEIDNFNVMQDIKVQCFLGNHSTFENLKLIPKSYFNKINKLKEIDKDIIFKDLNGIVSSKMIDAVWNMIYKRWVVYENFCNN